jgi:hypothetical protein
VSHFFLDQAIACRYAAATIGVSNLPASLPSEAFVIFVIPQRPFRRHAQFCCSLQEAQRLG